MRHKISVFAPATIANFGPGFDVFGTALDSIGDIVTAELLNDSRDEIIIKHVVGNVPRDAKSNTSGISSISALNILKEKYNVSTKGVALSIIKQIPQGGLGGSAASAVAGAVAINELFGRKLNDEEIISASLSAEKVVSGYHLDNILPCYLGGFVLIKSYNPMRYIKINPLKKMICVVANPMIMSYLTKDARKGIPNKDVVLKVNNKYLNELITGLKTNNIRKIGDNIRDDVVEPIRAGLIPGFVDVKNSALHAGAYGVSISGSGPSVFALCDDFGKAKKIGNEMKKAFLRNGAKRVVVIISQLSRKGARVLGEESRLDNLK